MKVLIAGATGQLGRALLASIPQGVQAIGVDRAVCDLAEPQQCHATVLHHRPDLVINAAAYTQVDKAETEREMAFRVNAEGPQALADAIARIGGRLIQVSTDFVFDGKQGQPYRPDAPAAPLNVYGASKRAGEEAVLSHLGNKAAVLRTAWVYSAQGNNFVRTMLRLLASRDSVTVVSDQVGSPTWSGSLAKAVWAAASAANVGGILHWTDGGVASWYDFAVAIQEEAIVRRLLDRAIPITAIAAEEYRRQSPASVPRPHYSVLETHQSQNLLGIVPPHWRVNLRSMLDELVS